MREAPLCLLNQPRHLLTAFQWGVAVQECNRNQGASSWNLRVLELTGITEPTSRESCPLFSSRCQCLLKSTVICGWNGFVNARLNTSLGGDKGSTSAYKRDVFLAKHGFAIHIRKYVNVCYRPDTTVSIIWSLWGWMERKGEEMETSILRACHVPGTIFYWIFQRTQERECCICYRSHFLGAEKLNVCPRASSEDVSFWFQSPGLLFFFLCLRAFALAIFTTWIALSQDILHGSLSPSFRSSLTWDKIPFHHSAPLCILCLFTVLITIITLYFMYCLSWL